MSDASAFGFGKFIPGFDFLHNLGKNGSSAAASSAFTNWVAPTVSIEEVEKRIEELKAVQFWLEQNSRALAATVQALEVQRMTLSTLKSMNVNLAEAASAFPFSSTAAAHSEATPDKDQSLQDWPLPSAKAKTQAPQPAVAPEPPSAPQSPTASGKQDTESEASGTAASEGPGMHAALQWWGALTQQFQQIAQQALQDPAQQQAVLQATQVGAEMAQNAMQAASALVRQASDTTSEPAHAKPAAAKRPSAAPASTPKKKAAVPRKTARAVQKAVSADKQAAPVAAKKKAVAAKKPSTSKTTRSR